jgi:hypothetical protein
MHNPESKRNRNKWLSLINIPLQMGIIIFAFAWFGGWLDENHPSRQLDYRTFLTLVGVALAMANVILQVNRMGKNS